MPKRFYRWGPEDPYVNLAREERLYLGRAEDEESFCVYVNPPCVVIGKNQNPWRECRVSALHRDGLPLLRRISGGGTVWHDEGNLNFAWIGPREVYDRARVEGFLARALGRLGLSFEVSDKGDLLAGGRKFSGNAFALGRTTALHHGTLLVQADLARLRGYLGGLEGLEGPGVASRPAPVVNLAELQPGLTLEAVAQALAGQAAAEGFEPAEADEAAARALAAERRRPEWVLGAGPRFRWTVGGGLCEVENGRIAGLAAPGAGPAADRAVAKAPGPDLTGDLAAEGLLGAWFEPDAVFAYITSGRQGQHG